MKIPFPILALALLSALSVPGPLQAGPIPDSCKIGGFAVGCQAYSFNRYTVFEAIEKTAATGSKVIEFYPGQRLSKDDPQAKFNHDSPPDVIAAVKAALAKHGVTAVNYGVVGIPADEAAARKVFEFARTMDVYAITTESVDSMDTIENLVKEFDVCVAFHNHPKRDNKPDYKVWDPAYVLSIVKDRDPRIGACADTGHWATSGLVPVDCVKILKGRIISAHLKDRPAMGPGQHDVPFGTGALNVKGVLEELKSQGFQGNISIEYEHNWENSVPEITQCIEFFKKL